VAAGVLIAAVLGSRKGREPKFWVVLECVRLNLVKHRRRDSNVGNGNLAAQHAAGQQEMVGLIAKKSNGQRRRNSAQRCAANHTIERLREERDLTLLFISHDLSVVYQYATNVLCLSRGQVCFGAPRIILTPQLLQELYGAPVGYHVHDDPRP